MKYLIGIDAGTSNVKAVLFNLEGKELFTCAEENQPIYTGAYEVEQDMNLIWEKTLRCLIDLVQKSGIDPKLIAAIGVTAQGEGISLIDSKGEPLQPAILWCDGRASGEVAEVLAKKPRQGAMIHEVTGTPPLTGTQLMLLKWMKKNRPDILGNADCSFFCKDWIRFKLTGEIGADYSDSGTSLLDVRKRAIAKDLLREVGLQDEIRLLPDPGPSEAIAGTLLPEIAYLTGLPENLPVINGALDVVASAFAIGAIHEGDTCVILGTTCAGEVITSNENCRFEEPGTSYEVHIPEDLFIHLMANMNGTPNLDWLIKTILGYPDFSPIDAMIETVPPGSHGIIYHLYISSAGERAPFYNPNARASFFGIDSKTSKEDLIRSVYEGITLSVRDCLDGCELSGDIYLVGDGTKSAVWPQIVSDVLGRNVILSERNEFGAKGATMLAGIGTGIYRDFQDAVDHCCHPFKVFTPDASNHLFYEEEYRLFRKLRESYQELWNSRAEYQHSLERRPD